MEDLDRVTNTLMSEYKMKNLGQISTFLGWDIKYTPSGDITITQSHYMLEILDKFGIKNCFPSKIPGTPNEHLLKEKHKDINNDIQMKFRRLIGGLIYAYTADLILGHL